MELWEFIKPDRAVLSLFSLLFTLSVILSIFIPGSPGYLCYHYQYGCSIFRGIGLPFAWADLYFGGLPSPECITPPYTCRADILPPESIMFNLINLVLDIVILYIISLLIVRIYENYFRKKKRK
jgi:hypothetical protein